MPRAAAKRPYLTVTGSGPLAFKPSMNDAQARDDTAQGDGLVPSERFAVRVFDAGRSMDAGVTMRVTG